MSDMKEKEEARQTRTERELEKLESNEQGNQQRKKKKKKKPAPAESRGTGRDFAAANQKVLLDQLNAKLRAAQASGNVDLVQKLEARKKALQSQ